MAIWVILNICLNSFLYYWAYFRQIHDQGRVQFHSPRDRGSCNRVQQYVIVKIHYIFTHFLFNHRIKYRVLITIFDITEHKCCPLSTLKYIKKNKIQNIFLSIIIYFLFCKSMKDFGSFTKPSDDTLVLLETN